MCKSQKFQRRTVGQKCDCRKVAPQHTEQIQLAMRQIIDAIAIEIKFEAIAPEIADAIYTPTGARHIGASGFYRMQVAREEYFP